MNLEQKSRHCNYCHTLFDSVVEFGQHWECCPVRVRVGYVNPEPTDPLYAKVMRMKMGWIHDELAPVVKGARDLGLNAEADEMQAMLDKFK